MNLPAAMFHRDRQCLQLGKSSSSYCVMPTCRNACHNFQTRHNISSLSFEGPTVLFMHCSHMIVNGQNPTTDVISELLAPQAPGMFCPDCSVGSHLGAGFCLMIGHDLTLLKPGG